MMRARKTFRQVPETVLRRVEGRARIQPTTAGKTSRTPDAMRAEEEGRNLFRSAARRWLDALATSRAAKEPFLYQGWNLNTQEWTVEWEADARDGTTAALLLRMPEERARKMGRKLSAWVTERGEKEAGGPTWPAADATNVAQEWAASMRTRTLPPAKTPDGKRQALLSEWDPWGEVRVLAALLSEQTGETRSSSSERLLLEEGEVRRRMLEELADHLQQTGDTPPEVLAIQQYSFEVRGTRSELKTIRASGRGMVLDHSPEPADAPGADGAWPEPLESGDRGYGDRWASAREVLLETHERLAQKYGRREAEALLPASTPGRATLVLSALDLWHVIRELDESGSRGNLGSKLLEAVDAEARDGGLYAILSTAVPAR